uniref:Armadillo repeat-containing protein 1 n=1 Tax=Eptatretus burgeri TaxID=7764 RepID=A0A8C4R552_EPTBU
MALAETPDALSVVNQLRDLASEPQNRDVIVRDHGCLPGLVLFLDHVDNAVVFSALQALRYLAESSANRQRMKSELGMMESLKGIVMSATSTEEDRSLASEIFELLARPSQAARGRRPQFFLGHTNKRAKMVILQVDGLTDVVRRSLCEEVLLKVRGVISFTFQMASQRCIIRMRSDLKAESLATAIAATKVMSAQQVVRTDSGEEMLVELGRCSDSVGENTELPEYLPEDESPTKARGRAVSRVGAKPEGGAASWLSTAAGFLTKSFYW